jgi:hypothetical protein
MVAPFPTFSQAFSFHNPFIIISQNLQRVYVDCSKFRPLEFGDAIATNTNNNKPTGPSYCLGGFSFVENLSTH